ncbi:MAG TPA: hypothetical protein VF613_07060, partial [Longimicrobium sp.]
MDWLTTKIPVGRWAADLFDWIETNGRGVVRPVKAAVQAFVDSVEWLLQFPHPLLLIALFVALTWALQRSWRTCLLVGLGLLYILNQGYWEATTQTLALVLASCVVCMGVGVPLGIAAAHRPWLYTWMQPVLDLMQTLPS